MSWPMLNAGDGVDRPASDPYLGRVRPIIRFGIFFEFDVGRPIAEQLDDLVELSSLAESAGFDSVWTGEHQPLEPSALLPSPLLVLTSIARDVTLSLGTGVLLAPLWHPLRLAYDSALVDQLSGGRLTLGLGVGNSRLWRRFGVSEQAIGRRMDDLLVALRRLWGRDDATPEQIAQLNGPIWPKPVLPDGIPLWIAGMSSAGVRRAASFGDAWYGATPMRLSDLDRLGRMYRDELSARDRNAAEARVVCNRLLVIVEHEREVRAVAEPHVSRVLRYYAEHNTLRTPDGVVRKATEDLFSLFDDDVYLVNTPEGIVRSLQRYIAAGVTDFQFRLVPGGLPIRYARRTIALFREQVLPNLALAAQGVPS